MSEKKNMNVVFLKHITGTLVFAGLFFVSALFVSFCFPVDESKDEKVVYHQEEPKKEELIKSQEADEKSEFYNTIIKAYTYTDGSLDATNENRTLSNGLKKLSIKLTNGIICEIYCQSVDVQIL